METPRNRVTRREMLKWMGLTTAAAALAACAPKAQPTAAPEAEAEAKDTPIPAAPTATPLPTAAPRLYGKGKTEIVVWYQDWDGANKIMAAAAPPFVESHPDVTINLQAIDYTALFDKMLPSIAAGTEGDVMNGYTNWETGTDIKAVFLDITDAGGGAKVWEEKMWPAAFQVIDAPEGKIFYLPWLAGIRGGATTVNTDHMKEVNADYLNWKSFEEVIDAGVKLTKKEGDKMVRAGFSPRGGQFMLLFSFTWQMGGKIFDKATGKWSWQTAEAEQAAQYIYDLYWKQQVCDYALFSNEWDAITRQTISIWAEGAYTAGIMTDVSKVPCDNIPTPFLANAKEKVIEPDHMAIWGLSKRLANNPDKLKAALDFAVSIVSPDALIQAFDFYSGVCMTKAVYQDPRIEKVKYGVMSKRVAEGMWPYARYNQDHVADLGPAGTEFDRAMRKEISIKEALANMDKYCQEQEDQARERIGLK